MKTPTAKQRRLRRQIKRSLEHAAKQPTQRVVFVITDTQGGQGKPEIDLEFQPGLAARKTNSNALNMGMRFKAIIEQHWQALIAPLPQNQVVKSTLILPPGFQL